MVLTVLINLGIIGTTDYTGIAILYRVTNSKAPASGLWMLILLLAFDSVWYSQTWQLGLAWTISRECGCALHRLFSKIFPAPFYNPI